MRGYDEYDTAPLDQLDENAILNAGPVDASDGDVVGVELLDLPF
jgi:hypothetical protein